MACAETGAAFRFPPQSKNAGCDRAALGSSAVKKSTA